MSVWSFLGNIVGVIGKVAGVLASVVKIVYPIFDGIRGSIDEVDEALTFLEENAAIIGEEGDDFLDRNAQVITDLETVSARGVVVFGKINELAIAMRIASQEQTPDTITAEEAERFIELIGEIKDGLGVWRPELDAAMKSMKDADDNLKEMALT